MLTMSDFQSAQTRLIKSVIRFFLMPLFLTLAIALPVAAIETPDVMLANVYRQHEDVTQFWGVKNLMVFELDGMASNSSVTGFATPLLTVCKLFRSSNVTVGIANPYQLRLVVASKHSFGDFNVFAQ